MRDHSAKSESKTTDRLASQLHYIQRNNVIVFNPRAISVAGRNFLRPQRWRFRPQVMEAQRSGSFSGPHENADMIVSRENLERLLENL